MATAAVDIPIQIKGLNELLKLERKMKAIELQFRKTTSIIPRLGRGVAQGFGNAAKAAERAAGRIKKAFKGAGGQISKFGKQLGGLRSQLLGLGVGAGLAKSFGAASELEAAQARVENLTQRYAKFTGIQELAVKSSEKFRVSETESLTNLVNLASRLGGTNTSLNDLLNVYEGFNTLLAVNKVGAQEAAGAQLQLFQALGEGKLFTQEYNSLIAATPQLLDEVAKVMGVSRGQLKKLSGEGKITSRDLITALTNIRTQGAADLENAFGGAFGAQKDFTKAVQEFSVVVGTELLPVLTPLLKNLAGLLEKFGQLPDPVKTAAVAMAGLGAAAIIAGPAVIAVAKGVVALLAALGAGKLGAAAAGMSKFALAGVGAKAAFAALLNPVTLAAAGVVALTGAIVSYNLKQQEYNRLVNDLTVGSEELKAAVDAKTAAYNKAKDRLDEMKESGVKNARAIQSQENRVRELKKQLENLEGVYKAQVLVEVIIPDFDKMGGGFADELKRELEALGYNYKPGQEVTRIKPKGNGLAGGGSSGGGAASAPTDDIAGLQSRLDLINKIAPLQDQILDAQLKGNDVAVAELEAKKALVEQEFAGLDALRALNTEEGKRIQTLINQEELGRIRAEGVYAVLEAEEAIKQAAEDTIRPLDEQRRLLEAKLTGTEEQVRLDIEIERLTKGLAPEYAEQVRQLVLGNAALKKRVTQMQEMQQLWDGIGSTIEDGILDSINAGIDAMVDGTKDLDQALQEIASGVLKDIGQMLIKFGLQQAFSALPGGGIGGALGNLFRAEGGPVTGGKPYIVGEQGPELMVPSTSGTVLSNQETMTAMARYGPNNARSIEELAMSGDSRMKSEWGYGSSDAPINISTGPVLEFDGNRYVTQEEFVRGVQNAAKQGEQRALRRLASSPGQRRKIGL